MEVRKIVLDSSVIVKWLNIKNEKFVKEADELLSDCQLEKVSLYAPELSKYEVGNAIIYKGVGLQSTKQSLLTLYSIPINFVRENENLALDSAEIAKKTKITYYDACFLALAKSIKAPLVTNNPKHQSKYKKVEVIPLQNYPKYLN